MDVNALTPTKGLHTQAVMFCMVADDNYTAKHIQHKNDCIFSSVSSSVMKALILLLLFSKYCMLHPV